MKLKNDRPTKATTAIKLDQTDVLPAVIEAKINRARSENKEIVLATGVFDLFHKEHLNFLKKARAVGGFLIVGIEPDIRVKKLKGKGRPVNSEALRFEQISKLDFVDCTLVLPDNFGDPGQPRALIAAIKPDILALSSHSPHLDKKQAILREFGGKVEVVHQYNPKISTTKIIEGSAEQR